MPGSVPLPEGFVIESHPTPPRLVPVPNAAEVLRAIYPNIEITDWTRPANSALGRANPNSWHVRSRAAVDNRALPGMTYEQFRQGIEDRGYHIIEGIDEYRHPSAHATGGHWHDVIGYDPANPPLDPTANMAEQSGDAGGVPIPPGWQVEAPPPHPAAPLLNLPSPLPTGPSLAAAGNAVAPVDPAIQGAVQNAFGSPPPTLGQQAGQLGRADLSAPPRQYHPPQQTLSDQQLAGLHTDIGGHHAAPADTVPTVPVNTVDDPRLAGANARIASMYIDPSVSNSEIENALAEYGIAPERVRGTLGAALAWRESPHGLRTWLQQPAAWRAAHAPPVNIDDMLLPEGQYREVASAADVPQGEARPWAPTWSERAGMAVQRNLEPHVGRTWAQEQGGDVEAGTQLAGADYAESALRHAQAAQEAQVRGEPATAAGHQVVGAIDLATLIPFFRRGRAGAETAVRALTEVEQLAARYGVRETGPARDAAIARLATERFGDLSPETQAVLADLSHAVGEDAARTLAPAHIGDLRNAANTPPSLWQRARQAVRGYFGRGRGAGEAEAAGGAEMTAGADIPGLPELSPPAASAGRTIDRIDVRRPPPPPGGFTLEDPLGRVHPLGEQPTPADMADVARSIRPQDVVPIPGNRIESAEEAARANPGTFQPVQAPDPATMLEMRSVPRWDGRSVRFRGPLDAESFLRSRGGIADTEGELRHIGITNNSGRPEVPGEARLGPIVNRSGGMPLDEAGRLLHEAGYLGERPTTADLVDLLRESRLGRRLWHPNDLGEVAGFEGAQAQRMQAEAAAAAGRPLAERIGSPVGPHDLSANDPPAIAYEDLPNIPSMVGNINLAHLETSEDISRALLTLERSFGGFDAARRGVISHAETRALADELGMTVDDLLRRRRGQALNNEQGLAARQLNGKSLDELVAMSRQALGPESSQVSKAAFAEAILRHVAIQEQVVGAAAEAGRALNAYRIAARSRAITHDIHQAAIEGFGGQRRLEDVAQAILDLHAQGATPGGITRFAVNAVKPRFRDKLVELWYNSLLSGPRTHAVNILSNLMTAGLQIPEHAAAAGIGAVRRGVGAVLGRADDFDRVMGSEIGARTFGMMQGTREGLRAFGRTMRTGEVADQVTKVEARTQHAISGVKGSVLRTPTRLLAAEDELFKGIGRRMELNGQAVRQARAEGLRGQAFRDRVADLSSNPTDEMIQRSLDYARYITFQRPLEAGSLAQAISMATQNRPWLKLFVPFVRTPANLLKFAVERSPAALALRSVRADFKAGGARRDLAIARMALGTGLALTVAELANRGIVTGGGPADRGALDLMRGDGWQPYSIRIGDTYYSYARMDPISTTLGVAADMVDFSRHMTASQRSQAGALLAVSIIRNLGNKTWLSGISDVVSAIDDPQRSLPQLFARLGASIAVPALVSQTAGVLDPTMRDTHAPTFNTEGVVPETLGMRSIIDPTLATIQSRLPGVSQNLPARRDVWGQPITREGSLGPDILSPFSTSTARDDPITAELLNLGASIGRPSRTLNHQRLTPEQAASYAEMSGRYIRDDLTAALADPGWQAMDPQERLREIDSIKRTARADARADLGLDGSVQIPAGWEVQAPR